MLKATFQASFDMEAAMPQLLEAAIYDCYEKYGWDIDDDTNIFCDNPFEQNGLYFPTLSDLIVSLRNVTGKQGFDKRLENDYIGSLISRINGIIVGSKGQMLNCKKSIDFDKLLDMKVIFELEDVKSGGDKSLIIGFILSRLAATIKRRHNKTPNFKHLILVEEAHRLLSKFEPGDSMNKKLGVEVFTDLLAEVRKYGESLIIVDQIPNKLTPEILKNTNTKIIHKLFAKDDKESVGDTMSMSDEQKAYLSNLKTGEAVIFSEGWSKPVLSKITMISNTSSNEVKLQKIIDLSKKIMLEFMTDFFPELGFIDKKEIFDFSKTKKYKKDKKRFIKSFDNFRCNLKKVFEKASKTSKKSKGEDTKEKIIERNFGEHIKEFQIDFKNCYLQMKEDYSDVIILNLLKLHYNEIFIGKHKEKISVLVEFLKCLSEEKSIYLIYSNNREIFNK